VGDGPELAESMALGKRLLGDRVRFLGHRDDVESILAASDIAVLWSGYEGMPVSLLEAMRAGLCCTASDLPGTRALLGDPPAGLLARSRDQLTTALRRLLGERADMSALGARARSRYEERFSAEAMERSTRAVYATVRERRSRAVKM
jgi:glycosyltransferase involved in cell wall biosynthesis